MAIEPIKGFYVYDEATDTDGVAKYDYDALENAPEISALLSETNGTDIAIEQQQITQCFIPKGAVLSVTNGGSNTHWTTFYADFGRTEVAINGSNYNAGQTKTLVAPKDIFIINIDGSLSDVDYTVKVNSFAEENEQSLSDVVEGASRELTKNINRVYIPANTTFAFKNNAANRWVTFYADEEMSTVAIAGRNYGEGAERIVTLPLPVRVIKIDGYTGEINCTITSYPSQKAEIERSWYRTVLQFKPRIDHLFVNDTTGSMTIPHESLEHVRLSKWFGFNVIEANLWLTSDGVFVVNHMSDGKFGNYFVHVDGTTDISQTAVASVTWDWICENVVYNSTINKYKHRPPRLEEFLAECKKCEIIPLVTANIDALEIVDQYMGANNYIAYGAENRANVKSAVIVNFKGLTTKEDILQNCRNVGAPYIYCMSNPSSFTDEQLLDIADALHSEGYLLGTAYSDEKFDKYQSLGFDQFGATNSINRLDNANVELTTVYGFDKFSTTNATESEGVLTFSQDGTITPRITGTTHDITAVDVEVEFSGEIVFPSYGIRRYSTTKTETTRKSVYTTYVGVGVSDVLSITAKSGTKVYNISYKVKYM